MQQAIRTLYWYSASARVFGSLLSRRLFANTTAWWSSVPIMSSLSSQQPPVRSIVNDIEKSPEDDRHYRGLLLDNGIRAVLVSDPRTDKSAATVCVRVGSLKDPREWQGLAHFCEHMLFLGTEKYPDESSYLRFINEHGGARNAVTTGEFTRYFFDIAPGHLPEALDRLSQFFIRPLFTESATEREVHAVHSEHTKNIPIDMRRMFRLDHHLASEKHDYSKFSTGSLETLLPEASLSGQLRSQLLAFHAENYSANRTSVAVLGKESLNELQALVVDAFSAVSNKDLPANAWDCHPYDGTQCGVKVFLVPLRDGNKLQAVFPMVDYTDDYACSPDHYASHLLGHESSGSLLAYLKLRGWANALSAGCSGGAAGYDFFRVSIDLTEAGLASQDAVIGALFEYIGVLRSAGPQEWIFNEMRDLGQLEFRFRDKDHPIGAASRLAVRLHHYPMRDLLTARSVLTEFSPDKIAQVLDQLRPERCKVFIASKSHESICPADAAEPIYGVRYKVEAFSPELMSACAAAFVSSGARTPDLHLPQPNAFISTDFALKAPSPPPTSAPQLVRQDRRRLRLWHRQDDEYKLPKLCLTVALATPGASTDAFAAACAQLHCRLVNDALNSVLYDAELAGLSGAVAATGDGLVVSLHGYSEKLPALLDAMLDRLARPDDIDPVRFGSILERYQKTLRNFPLEQPLHQCYFNQSLLCNSVAWSHDEKLTALSDLTPDRAAEFARQLQSRQFADVLVYGNADAASAEAVGDALLRRLQAANSTFTAPSERRPHRVRDVLLPSGRHLLHRTLTEHHQSSACVVYYQTEPEDWSLAGQLRHQVLTKLTVQALKERFFDSLRTKQQLGYMVQLAERSGVAVCGLAFGVQSDRHPVELEARIDEFVDASESHLAAMPADQFLDHVAALNTRITEQPKRMAQRNARYHAEIASGALCFDRAERQSRLLLDSVSQAALQRFYKTWISKHSPQRRKLSVHVISQKTFGSVVENRYVDYSGTIVSDVASFKCSSRLGPLPISAYSG